MAKRMLAAFALILAMTAAAEAQYTTLQGWIIVPGNNHSDNFEVRITAREGYEPYASTTVSDTGRYMFTNLDLNVGNFDILINVEGYRESRTRLATLPPNIMRTDFGGRGMNIILIPDPESRRNAEKRDAYNKALLDEYAIGLDQITNKHPELAVTHLEKVANEVPDFYDAHINLGFVYQDLLRWRDAEKEFRSAHELNAESSRPLVALGRLRVEEVELEIEAGASQDVLRPILVQARQELTEAIMLDPKLAKAFYYLGAVDFRSRSYADAESESKHALELDPRLFEARILRINLFIEQKLWQAALDNADAFMLDYPDSSHRAEVADRRMHIVARLDRK
jgi:tetratricopeptide (TPR) repeat protein